MEAMSWAAKPTIDSVHPQEPAVLACREQIQSALATSLQPAYDYIAKVQAYESWLTIDAAAYVDALQARRPEYRAVLEKSLACLCFCFELERGHFFMYRPCVLHQQMSLAFMSPAVAAGQGRGTKLE